jgi:hypothetical protein
MTDRTRREHTMKRTAIILGVAAAMGVAPSAALGGNVTAQVANTQVVRQVVSSQVVSSQVVRQVVRPQLVRSALVRSAPVRPALLNSRKASAAHVAQIRLLLR